MVLEARRIEPFLINHAHGMFENYLKRLSPNTTPKQGYFPVKSGGV